MGALWPCGSDAVALFVVAFVRRTPPPPLLSKWPESDGETSAAHHFPSVWLTTLACALGGDSSIKKKNNKVRGDASISPVPFLPAAAAAAPLAAPAIRQDKVHGVSVTRLLTALLTVVSTAFHFKHVNGAAQLDVKLPLPLLSLPPPPPLFLLGTSAPTPPPPPTGAVTMQQQRKYTKIK